MAKSLPERGPAEGHNRPISWHHYTIGSTDAWSHAGGGGTTIAIIDERVDVAHPEFTGKIVESHVTKTSISDPLATWKPHGTMCAGVACARGYRVTGVAPEAELMPIEVNTLGDRIGTVAESDAVRWAAQHGADVISCSWGPPDAGYRSCEPPLHMVRAIEWAVQNGRCGRGCVITWSAGNLAADLKRNGYATNPNVVAIGACNDIDKRSRYSNWGDALWCVFPSGDPGAADGVVHKAISTTTPTGSFLLGETYYTGFFGYTSAACAGVAGLCALILSANPDLHWWEVKEIIRDSCVKIDEESGTYDDAGHSPLYGYGRPDAGAAVRLAIDRHKRATPSPRKS